jgi:hypothetical protein
MRKVFFIAFTVVAAAASVAGQTIAITNGKVYPVGSAPIDNGTVLFATALLLPSGPTYDSG